MKRVVFFLSLLIVVFCSSCEKEEIPLEQKILGEWNLDLTETTILQDGVAIYESSFESDWLFSFKEDRVFLITFVEGESFEINTWETLTDNSIIFERTVYLSRVNICTVEKIDNVSCVLKFNHDTVLTGTRDDGSKYEYIETTITKYILSRKK